MDPCSTHSLGSQLGRILVGWTVKVATLAGSVVVGSVEQDIVSAGGARWCTSSSLGGLQLVEWSKFPQAASVRGSYHNGCGRVEMAKTTMRHRRPGCHPCCPAALVSCRSELR